MSYILLTRPLDDALEMERALHAPVIKAPLLEIQILPQNQLVTTEIYTHLIVTSARSLTIFSQTSSFLQKPVWCVGAKTADMAKKVGFETIYTAHNSAEELCYMIMAKTNPHTEKFLHICGENLHYDIVEALQSKGYQAEKQILYKTIPTKHFSPEVLEKFTHQHLCMIPVFSRKTAETLKKVLHFHQLENNLQRIVLISCAHQIIEPLKKLKWKQIIIAQDLSASVLETIYQKLQSGKNLETSKPWSLLIGTGVVSLLISLVCFFFILPYMIPPVDTKTIQKAIVDSLKTDQRTILNEKDLNDLVSQIAVLKQEIHYLKEQSDVPTIQSVLDDHLKVFLIAGQIEEQMHLGKADPYLWQEIKKLILKIPTSFPEQLPLLQNIPPTKQELLQNLEKRALEKSSSTNVPERGRKVEDPWLKKAEEYIGQIIIHKAESSLKQEDQLSLEEQALTVVKTNDLSQIKELIKSLKTPADIKEILGKAEERLLVLDGLKRIKASSLQRLLQNRK